MANKQIFELTNVSSPTSSHVFPVQPGDGSTSALKITISALKTALVLVKGDVGLGNVDNTSDANKPISSAIQAALNLKANIASPTFTGTVSGISKSMVGLSNVDNTSDANKPVSTLQASAIAVKQDTLVSGTNIKTINSTSILGSGNITISGSGVTDHTLLTNIGTNTHAQIDTHIASATNPHSVTKSQVGLANVDNTADSAKPVSTAQQTALNLKANIASPTFTGTVSGITKSMVGLGSVDNTADTAKPISTAVQTALDLKADLSAVILADVTTVAATTYTLVIGDNNKTIKTTSGSATTITIPTNASVAFPVGSTILIEQWGAGAVSITPAGGVTLNSTSAKRKLAEQYAGATLRKDATDVWILIGNIIT